MSNQIVISSGAKVRSLNGVITGTTGVLDSLPINAANGIPQLDVNGKILVSQLPNSVMEYQGTWNANTNTPTLTNGGAFNQGDVYLCNVAGTTNFGAGPIAFVVGDQVIYSGSIWQRASGSTGTVTSVAVTETGDALTITGSPITTSGTINVGFAGTSAQYVAGNGALVTFPTLTGYVPYTGATSNLNLGNHSVLTDNGTYNAEMSPSYFGVENAAGTIFGVLEYNKLTLTNSTGAGSVMEVNAQGLIFPDASVQTKAGLTSVGLSMPSAFSVANSPLTANGTIAVTGAGYASQYIRGDGTLADFPSSGGGGSSVSYYLNGGTSQGVIGGTTYYEMSKTADTGTGVDFPKTGDGLIVSFLTDANDPAQLNIPAGNWNYEIYVSMSSNGGTPQLYAELYKYDGTTFTLISTSSNEIIYDGVNLNLYTFAMAVPTTTLTVTDRLAVKLYATNSGGKTTTVHTQNGHLCQVITTFSTGITALNGLTTQVQYLATGTSGTDFNISSATATHTFNLPTASATNRGALSSADWTTFNNKQPAIGYTPANDALVVHLAGTETITGNKTFSGDNVYSGVNVYNTYQTRFTVGIAINQTLSGGAVGSHTVIGANVNGLNVNFPGGGYNSLNFASTSVGNTYTFPNATGTLALTSDIPSLTGYVTGTGTSGQVTYFNGTSSVTSSSSFKFDGTNLTIGNPSSALAQLHIYNASAAASFLLQTDSTTDYSEIAVRNNSSTATSYFRQYSTAATGSDFGISRAGLALFFSNYATNFAIGTRNGGSLIFGTADTERARFDTSGNFGIGSSNPSNYTNLTSLTINGTSGSVIDFKTGEVLYGELYSLANEMRVDAVGASGTLKLLTNSVARLTIASTGAATFSSSVTANGLFTAQGGVSAAPATSGTTINGSAVIKPSDGSNAIIMGAYGTAPYGNWIQSQSTSALGTTFPLILQPIGGNLGIGTSSPTQPLHVYATSTTTSSFFETNSANSYIGLKSTSGICYIGNVSYAMTFEAGGSERMRITSGGQVYVGTTGGLNGTLNSVTLSGQYALSLFDGFGNSAMVSIRNSSNTEVGSITIISGTATAYNTTSDYRLKEDLQEIKGLELVNKIKVYDFKWKGTEQRMDGVIAHELQEVIPYAVNGEKDADEMQQVDYSKLVPILVKSIQELEARLKTIENK